MKDARKRSKSETREEETPSLLSKFENLRVQTPSSGNADKMHVDDDTHHLLDGGKPCADTAGHTGSGDDKSPANSGDGAQHLAEGHRATPDAHVERPPNCPTATGTEGALPTTSAQPTPPNRSTVMPSPWEVSLVRYRSSEITASFHTIQQKTGISSVGRVITVPNLAGVDLTKSQRTWLRRFMFLTSVPAGSIRTVEGVFPLKGFKLHDLVAPSDLKANAFLRKTTLNDYIYLRGSKKYWVVPDNFKKGSKDGFCLPEIPPSVITLEFRHGYRTHLQDERALDEGNPALATYESRNSFNERLAQMASWCREDPHGHIASLQIFLNSRAIKTEVNHPPSPAPAASAMEEGEENLRGLVRDPPPPPPLEDEIEEPVLAEIAAPASSSEGGISLSQQGIQLLVNRPFRDAGYLKAAEDWRPELLKLRPNLQVCRSCGDKSHASNRCNRSLSGGNPHMPSGEAWCPPEPTSLAAKMLDGFVCPYPLCRVTKAHVLSACDDLHQRCARCRARGHSSEIWDVPEQPGHYETHCPMIAQDQNSRIADSATSPTWDELLLQFESCASSGEMTKFRFHSAGCGFYPAQGEGDLEVLKALGYRWMSQLAAAEAIGLISSIHGLCDRAFGTRSLQYTELSDSEWNLVFQRREAKRARELRESQAQAKEASRAKARKHSPSTKRVALPPSNVARSGRPAKAGTSSRSGTTAPLPTPQVYPGTHAPMIPQMYPGTTAPPLTPQVFSPLPAGDPNPPTPVYGAAAPRVQPSFGYVYTPEQLAKWHEMSNQALPPPPGQGFKRIPKTGNRE